MGGDPLSSVLDKVRPSSRPHSPGRRKEEKKRKDNKLSKVRALSVSRFALYPGLPTPRLLEEAGVGRPGYHKVCISVPFCCVGVGLLNDY